MQKRTFYGVYKNDGRVPSLCFSSDGNHLLIGGCDGNVKLFDVKEGEASDQNNHGDPVNSVCFSSDGNYLLIDGYDGKVKLFDVKEGEVSDQNNHFDWINLVCLSPDGRDLASIGCDRNVILLDFIKLLISRNKPKQFSSLKEYLLWLTLYKGKLSVIINEQTKSLFDEMPEAVKGLFSLDRGKEFKGNPVWRLRRAVVEKEADIIKGPCL